MGQAPVLGLASPNLQKKRHILSTCSAAQWNILCFAREGRFYVMQVPGAEKILYGLDDVRDSGEIVVVEGEMDKLALEEAGVTNVVSVPDGAPRQVKEGTLPPPEEDTKYLYLWNCRAILDQAVRIVLATDSDAPGQVGPLSRT